MSITTPAEVFTETETLARALENTDISTSEATPAQEQQLRAVADVDELHIGIYAVPPSNSATPTEVRSIHTGRYNPQSFRYNRSLQPAPVNRATKALGSLEFKQSEPEGEVSEDVKALVASYREQANVPMSPFQAIVTQVVEEAKWQTHTYGSNRLIGTPKIIQLGSLSVARTPEGNIVEKREPSARMLQIAAETIANIQRAHDRRPMTDTPSGEEADLAIPRGQHARAAFLEQIGESALLKAMSDAQPART